MLLFLICFETQEEIEFQDLFFREVDRKCFNCNHISRLLTYDIFDFTNNSYLVIRFQSLHGLKRTKTLVKNIDPDQVIVPNSEFAFKMIGAISFYNYTCLNDQGGHFVFWKRNCSDVTLVSTQVALEMHRLLETHATQPTAPLT